MKLGIKIAPGKQRYEDLARTQADFTEVWYHANKPNLYADLFSHLAAHAPQSGLHFWGETPEGYLATVCYPDKNILAQSLALIKKTIDIAAHNHFSYVNIHPGTRSLVHLDFDTMCFTVKTPPKDIRTCEPIFLEHAETITTYGKNNGVVVTIESVPPKTANQWLTTKTRTDVIDLGELPLKTLLRAIDQGAWFANDFSHTAATFALADPSDTAGAYKMLYDVSKTYAPQTKLVHIGFLVPPFNGTDFHDHMDHPLLQTTRAIPNAIQLTKLLLLYKNRDDVYGLVEPIQDHVRNYFLAKSLLQNA